LDRASGSHGDDSRGDESCGSTDGRLGVLGVVFVELLRIGVVVDVVVLWLLLLVALISCEASPLGVAFGEEAAAAGGGSLTMVGE